MELSWASLRTLALLYKFYVALGSSKTAHSPHRALSFSERNLCTRSPDLEKQLRQAEPRACWQLELTFHGELSLHLVQFILKRNTEKPD